MSVHCTCLQTACLTWYKYVFIYCFQWRCGEKKYKGTQAVISRKQSGNGHVDNVKTLLLPD